jgi:hypothetical protein
MRERLALDIAQFALDLVEIVDPFGVADGINAVISMRRGMFWTWV